MLRKAEHTFAPATLEPGASRRQRESGFEDLGDVKSQCTGAVSGPLGVWGSFPPPKAIQAAGFDRWHRQPYTPSASWAKGEGNESIGHGRGGFHRLAPV